MNPDAGRPLPDEWIAIIADAFRFLEKRYGFQLRVSPRWLEYARDDNVRVVIFQAFERVLVVKVVLERDSDFDLVEVVALHDRSRARSMWQPSLKTERDVSAAAREDSALLEQFGGVVLDGVMGVAELSEARRALGPVAETAGFREIQALELARAAFRYGDYAAARYWLQNGSSAPR